MRVLLGIHHPLDPNMGAPGVTLALGQALAAQGCQVDFFSYDDAYPGLRHHTTLHELRFPWKLTAHLLRAAERYDVLDITTGDAWPWMRLGRPGARARHALVTRSHGLEHTFSERLRADARAGLLTLSWKYPLYHGGYRLWEVRQSLLRADHAVLLNTQDAAYVTERLGVPAHQLSVIPHGLDAAFHDLPPPAPGAPGAPLRVACVGSWLALKGRAEMVDAATRLQAEGVSFTLTLYGTGNPEAEVLAAFPAGARERVRVVPRYERAELPRLLRDEEVLFFPSHSEGFGMALVESMASGLVPVSTPVGVAPQVVRDGQTGRLVPMGDVDAQVAALRSLAEDRARLLVLRGAAQAAVKDMTWRDIAARTLRLYEQLLRSPRTV
ncbi:glycosyltransferase family 4 protein [Corallococcus macrosporus]|uniref:Group 1 family glycosyl transferase n=1 Tax=Myxococcus fulvus (strain ATCC BAA-855 / HW-1) TaxID=483219 RepID=F8CJA7_MYXFH|nr:glycosyltransferase family 4 protein [Corallococcus macrosporus]AEI62620.1 group 1 family glycosyl transferase [Corallococcus macrosporus]